MNSYALKKLATNYMQIWNAGSEGLLDLYADDSLIVEYTHFAKVEGINAYKSILEKTYNYFQNMEIHLGEVIPCKKAERVTLFWSYSGIHENNSIFGIEPQGKQVNVKGVTVLKIKNKKVIQEKGVVDNMSLFAQLQQP